MENRSCPCTYGNPCRENCTCVVPTSSMGCGRCCTYGSLEQRRKKAEVLIELLKLGIEAKKEKIIEQSVKLVKDASFKLGEQGLHISPEELLDMTLGVYKQMKEEE